MNERKTRLTSGFTLTELCVALLFATIMILGTLGFSYHSRLDANKAELHRTSVGLAELIINDWKAAGGISGYDPVQSFEGQFEISQADVAATGLDNFLGSYHIKLDGNIFRVTLSYRNAVDDTPKALNVVVDWIEQSRIWDATDPRNFVKLSAYIPKS